MLSADRCSHLFFSQFDDLLFGKKVLMSRLYHDALQFVLRGDGTSQNKSIITLDTITLIPIKTVWPPGDIIPG
jgi:hypothetical protein